jgi:UDP-N-acetylglucosamine transferase subunit ALG13
MILVTVGTDQPFDRLIKVVDLWAKQTNRKDVFAQIGDNAWEPEFVGFEKFLEPPRFRDLFSSASIIVAHAGMGTILSALHYRKPILVMPRKASLGEQRNEHQLATAKYMNELKKVNVAFDESELLHYLNKIDKLIPRDNIGMFAQKDLISGIQDFINGINRR